MIKREGKGGSEQLLLLSLFFFLLYGPMWTSDDIEEDPFLIKLVELIRKPILVDLISWLHEGLL